MVGGPRGRQLRAVRQVAGAEQCRHAGAATGRLPRGARRALPQLQVALLALQGRLHALQVRPVQFSGQSAAPNCTRSVYATPRTKRPHFAVLHRLREALQERRQMRQGAGLLQEGAACPPPKELPPLPPAQGRRRLTRAARCKHRSLGWCEKSSTFPTTLKIRSAQEI